MEYCLSVRVHKTAASSVLWNIFRLWHGELCSVVARKGILMQQSFTRVLEEKVWRLWRTFQSISKVDYFLCCFSSLLTFKTVSFLLVKSLHSKSNRVLLIFWIFHYNFMGLDDTKHKEVNALPFLFVFNLLGPAVCFCSIEDLNHIIHFSETTHATVLSGVLKRTSWAFRDTKFSSWTMTASFGFFFFRNRLSDNIRNIT